jgi:hypothetical protein
MKSRKHVAKRIESFWQVDVLNNAAGNFISPGTVISKCL